MSTDAFVFVSFIVLRVDINYSEVYSYLTLSVILAPLAPRKVEPATSFLTTGISVVTNDRTVFLNFG